MNEQAQDTFLSMCFAGASDSLQEKKIQNNDKLQEIRLWKRAAYRMKDWENRTQRQYLKRNYRRNTGQR